MAKQHKCQFWY